MFRINRKLLLFVTALLLASLSTSSTGILPVSAGYSGSPDDVFNYATSYVPIQVFPSGTIPISSVIYIWTPVENATKYQLQVFRGSKRIYNHEFDASVCAAGTCSVNPSKIFANRTFKWRVRAYVGGQYRAFSPKLLFMVNVPSTSGFNSTFNTHANGWVVHKGTWKLESANYFATVGIADKVSSISHKGIYYNLTYQARLKRSGCVGCANALVIRGTPNLDGVGWWKTEYTFDYTNSGLFSVWRDNNGTYTALKDWTSTNAIDENGWNTLKVTANGSQLKFYINGVLVWSGVDSTYPSGRVGIAMYRSPTSTGDKLWVDWAKLSTSVADTADADLLTTGIEIGGGDRNMAP